MIHKSVYAKSFYMYVSLSFVQEKKYDGNLP